ncbi:hypothetical protein [Okeania sp.]|uniref:hypothetical protein n=1 Tax=Okeania sp. TaxID=3100323 RepID=UPI002B4ACF89|nr:hypothetical protein [Okeania sp.]MEB3343694.1 hypothetical protein [Okeania sp.]
MTFDISNFVHEGGFIAEGRRKKEEGRRKKEEERRKKKEERRKKKEERRKNLALSEFSAFELS